MKLELQKAVDARDFVTAAQIDKVICAHFLCISNISTPEEADVADEDVRVTIANNILLLERVRTPDYMAWVNGFIAHHGHAPFRPGSHEDVWKFVVGFDCPLDRVCCMTYELKTLPVGVRERNWRILDTLADSRKVRSLAAPCFAREAPVSSRSSRQRVWSMVS